jgi:hypothetical protein
MNDFKAMFPEAKEFNWEMVRIWRDRKLAASDWTQTLDAPVDKAAWATYRQALRDLPAQGGIAEEAVFPTQPGGN